MTEIGRGVYRKRAFQESGCDWLAAFRLGFDWLGSGCVSADTPLTNPSLSCSYFCLKLSSSTAPCHVGLFVCHDCCSVAGCSDNSVSA